MNPQTEGHLRLQLLMIPQMKGQPHWSIHRCAGCQHHIVCYGQQRVVINVVFFGTFITLVVMLPIPKKSVSKSFVCLHFHKHLRSQVSEPWNGETYRDLRAEYYNIFKHGNRNAASHLWSSFLLQRSQQMTPYRLEHMFTGFCAVSGSPVSVIVVAVNCRSVCTPACCC